MNPLEPWKSLLKAKPDVGQFKPVEVKIEIVKEKEKEKEQKKEKGVTIRTELETGFDRGQLKKRLLENNLAKVSFRTKAVEMTNDIEKEEKEKEKEKEKEDVSPLKPSKKRAKKIGTMKLSIIEEQEEETKEEETKEEEEKEEETKEEEKEEEKGERKREKKDKGVIVFSPQQWIEIGETPIQKRIQLKEKESAVTLKVSSYYMNNREIFIQFIQSLFEPYKKEIERSEKSITCDSIKPNSSDVSLLTHQKVIRDYMNLYTPYRGLLLYHGLGSGKTLSSIALAEGMKSSKKIIVMTPASLRRNYMEELKKGGDALYRKNQFWEWISVAKRPEALETLSSVLQLPVEYIKRKKGAWLVNMTKPSNYSNLTTTDKKALDEQLDEMIQAKYTFINYNGLRRTRLSEMTFQFERNLFDNAVVIIDEAHNFISRIVNKLSKEKDIPVNARGEKEHEAKSLSLILYDQLLRANNCRVILLTGTPIINYPNEIAVLFNILRGYIKTWELPLDNKTKRKMNQAALEEIFLSEKVIDYIQYSASTETLFVTRNPFGFKNKIKQSSGYHGVTNEKKDPVTGKHVIDPDYIDDSYFEKRVIALLKQNDIGVLSSSIRIHNYKALPDKLDTFMNRFLDENKNVKDIGVFKRRIVGLTSYFRSAEEDLLPRYEKTPEYYHVQYIPMSDYQFGKYEAARKQERKLEKNNKKSKSAAGADMNSLYKDASSTYRIFSRLFCNFVMPVPPGRPLPKANMHLEQDEGTTEETEGKETNAAAAAFPELLKQARLKEGNQDLTNDEEGEIEGDVVLQAMADETYDARIQKALAFLKDHSSNYLTLDALQTYSPKYAKICENIINEDNKGLHLVYSQFRTLEGIGIFKLVLQQSGFAEFRLKKSSSGIWEIDRKEEDQGKPTFALYTGTENAEEREIIRNIYNGDWDVIPTNIASELQSISLNNNMGEIIKVLMITSSGSEGINLKNTRYVHIMEPYWHPVRMEQVIGRARRICSHKDLPVELQSVEVFVYLMTFTEKQKKGDESIELKLNDLSKRTPFVPLTSDEALYEISMIKEEVNAQLIKAVKESAIDCAIYSKKSKEGLQCLTFGEPGPNVFSYVPNIDNQEQETIEALNKKKIKWEGKPITIDGVRYVYREMSKNVLNIYDLESYERVLETGKGDPRLIGTLETKGNGERVFLPLAK